jgi:hypothetical protein
MDRGVEEAIRQAQAAGSHDPRARKLGELKRPCTRTGVHGLTYAYCFNSHSYSAGRDHLAVALAVYSLSVTASVRALRAVAAEQMITVSAIFKVDDAA